MSTNHAAMHLGHKPAALHIVHEKDILTHTTLIPEPDASLEDPTLNQSAAEASENPATQDLACDHVTRKIPNLLRLVQEAADKRTLIIMPGHNTLSNINIKTEEPGETIRRNLNVSLHQKKIIEPFTDAFIDKHILSLNNPRKPKSMHLRSNKNGELEASKSRLHTIQNHISVTVKTVILPQARNTYEDRDFRFFL
jgi:hypothetical protein